MKEFDIVIKVKCCQLEELENEDRTLVEAAINATDNAYAEYSHFHVWAALRL